MNDHEVQPAIPAATVIVFRRAPGGGPPEILMVERSAAMAFAGGAAVFPGGRVDPADYDLARSLGFIADDAHAEAAARIAAIRETLEETGLVIGVVQAVGAAAARAARALLEQDGTLAAVLCANGWSLDLDALFPFARWRPDHRGMRNFDTRFYLADIGTGDVEIAVDQSENTHMFWASAAGSLELADSGRISIIFPTRRNLERLAQFASFASARDHAEAVPVRTITPIMQTVAGECHLVIPADLGYPVTSEKLDDVQRQ